MTLYYYVEDQLMQSEVNLVEVFTTETLFDNAKTIWTLHLCTAYCIVVS